MALTDDFNRADGAIGAGWETVLGTATPWIIESNAAEPGAAQQLSVTRRTEANFPSDHYSQCVTEHTSDGVNDPSTGGVAVRVQANGDCYRARVQGGFATLSRVVSGVSTFLTDFVVSPSIPDNTLHTIRLTAAGSLLTVRVNGTDVGSFSDSVITGGRPGMAQVVGSTVIRARHDNFESSDALSGEGLRLPKGAFVEVPVDVAKVTSAPFKSDLIALNNARRATLVVQTSSPLTAGQWVLKAALTNDLAIGGHPLATVNFPVAPARVASQTAQVAHRLAYVEQLTAPVGGTIEKMSLLIQ